MEPQVETEVKTNENASKIYWLVAIVIIVIGALTYYLSQDRTIDAIPVVAQELVGSVASIDLDNSQIVVTANGSSAVIVINSATITREKVMVKETGETVYREVNLDDISPTDSVVVEYLVNEGGVLSNVESITISKTATSLEDYFGETPQGDIYISGTIASFKPEEGALFLVFNGLDELKEKEETKLTLSPDFSVYQTGDFSRPQLKRFWIEGNVSDIKVGGRASLLVSGDSVSVIVIPIQ